MPLEYERLAPDCIHWQIWIAKTGATVLQRCEVRVHRNYAQSIGAALAGKRLARGCRDEQPLADSTRIPASN